jgi:bifunctional DNA-binding transcriptional regulator/antitoxin component of YhaV-PrlF toxin-antitoxin module
MAVALTEKGQITIPLVIRKRLCLKAGMRQVFDETVPFLKATREVNVTSHRAPTSPAAAAFFRRHSACH